MPTRINKYLSEAGYCSRRAADRLIVSERVFINNSLSQMGSLVLPDDIVRVDDKIVKLISKAIYLAFNKPRGITSSSDPKIKNNIIQYINYPTRIFHIGRLDKDSEGLILLTNDGDIVNEILRVENNHEKEYIVTVNREIDETFLKNLSNGVPILNTITKPCKTIPIDQKTFKIILTEGLNRQIRRMCKYFGYQVLTLKRIRIMHIKLDIPTGKYRNLKNEELDILLKLKHTNQKKST